MVKTRTLIIILLVLAPVVFLLQHEINASKDEYVRGSSRHFVPPLPDLVKVASLGYHTLVADFYWLGIIQYKENCQERGEFPDDLYIMTDFLTDLDARHCLPYFYAGLALSFEEGDPHDIIAILEKGTKNCPDYYRSPFLLGIYYYFEFQDYENAADYLEIACRLKKGHRLYCGLAGRIRSMAGNPELGIDLLVQMLDQVEDDRSQPALEFRIMQLGARIHERDLTAAVHEYHQRHGEYPVRIEDLFVDGPVLGVPPDGYRPQEYPEVPPHPVEGRVYVYDPAKKEVRSDPPIRYKVLTGPDDPARDPPKDRETDGG